MTSAADAPPAPDRARVAPWLLADTDEATRVLNDVLRSAPQDTTAGARLLSTLATVARAAVVDEVLDRLRTVLDDSLVDLLVAGWRQHAAITQAARESLGDPGSQNTVVLATHSITTIRRPQLDVQVDGLLVLTLNAACEIDFQVVEAVAVIRDGRLMELRAGQSGVTGTICVEEQEIARRSLQLPLKAGLDIRGGIPLLRDLD